MRLLGWLRARRQHACAHHAQDWRGLQLVCVGCGQLIASRLVG